MFITNNAHQTDESFLTETAKLKPEIEIVKPEVVIEKSPVNEPQWDGLRVNYTQKNGFFKGFLIALPVSVSLWVIIGLGIKSLFF